MSQKPAYGAMRDVVSGHTPRVPTHLELARAPGRRALALRGTLDTPGSQGYDPPVVLRLAWSPKRHGRVGMRRTVDLGTSGGRFAMTLSRARPGYWRAVAEYAGSSDFTSTTSNTVRTAVRR